MTTATITKIKNGSISLPREIRKIWKGAEVVVLPSQDSMYIKRISRPSLAEMKPKLQKLGRLVSQKDINEAIRQARKKVYKSRS